MSGGRQVDLVADRLHSAAIHLLRRAREQDAESGLGPARLSALSVVVFVGPLTVGELAAAEGVRSATMTGIVNGLEADRLVRRVPHGQDRRSVLVESTSAGRRLLERARTRRLALIADRLARLPADDVALLGRAADLLDELFPRASSSSATRTRPRRSAGRRRP
jgi:DNA-binding MarR family transcriptional regulator